MKTCNNCGAQVPDEKKFCGACGYKFTADETNSGGTQSQSQNYNYSQQNGQQNKSGGDFASKANAAFNSGADHTAEFDPQDIAANKIYGILACFGILFFIPLVAAPQSKYGKFFANQGLLLLLASFVCGIAVGIVNAIFAFLWFIFFVGSLISFIIGLIPFVLFIILLINAANGRAKELPFIGGITIIK